MGLVDICVVTPHHFQADQPPFWSKYAGEHLSSCVMSSQTSPFSVKPIPTLEQNQEVV